MSTSIIDLQRKAILEAIRSSRRRDSRTGLYIEDGSVNRIIIVDEYSAKILANIAKKHEIMDDDVLNILMLDDSERRHYTTEDAVYLLSPQPYVFDYLKDDLNQGRHQRAFVLWTSQPPNSLCKDLYNSRSGSEVLQNARTLWVDFFPMEPNLVTLREPDSFQICFNRTCDSHVMHHLYVLAHKIVSVCVSLGEYPIVRYYRPPDPLHRASVLCQLLAERVQTALSFAQKTVGDAAAQGQNSRSLLIITDRSMDIMAPFVHETTYQAVAVDVLPDDQVYNAMDKLDVRVIFEDEKKQTLSSHPSEAEQQQNEARKDRGLDEDDIVWSQYRHSQLVIVLETLKPLLEAFGEANKEFEDRNPSNIRSLQTQVAKLHDYMREKATYELHIAMAEQCSAYFTEYLSLIDIEQLMTTGLDPDGAPAKEVTEMLVAMLDEIGDELDRPERRVHRLRLLIAYIIYRDGLLRGDIEKLRHHANLLAEQDREKIYNLCFLGARVERELKNQGQNPPNSNPNAKDKRQPLFEPRNPPIPANGKADIARFQPVLKYMLEAVCRGTLDSAIFPFTRPELEDNNVLPTTSQSSLRTSNNKINHTWTKPPPMRRINQAQGRIIVFMAGGATFSESRACHEITQAEKGREVYLITPEMLKPSLFLEQVGRLHLRSEEVLTPLPRKVFQPLSSGRQGQGQLSQEQISNLASFTSQPPVNVMQNMNLGPPRPLNPARLGSSPTPTPPSTAGSFSVLPSSGSSYPLKEEKEKKRKLFGLGRKH